MLHTPKRPAAPAHALVLNGGGCALGLSVPALYRQVCKARMGINEWIEVIGGMHPKRSINSSHPYLQAHIHLYAPPSRPPPAAHRPSPTLRHGGGRRPPIYINISHRDSDCCCTKFGSGVG